MSELERIQQFVREEIIGYIEFAQISVLADSIDNPPTEIKNLSKIVVMRPLPISATTNADYPVFDNVEIKLKVYIPLYENTGKSILYYCEKLCKKLHNRKISTRNNVGRILISKINPIEIISKNNHEIATINFIINGVKIWK